MPTRKNPETRRADRSTTGGRSRAGVSADARRKSLASLAAESDRQLEDLIARRLALPVEKRMNFLRRRLPGGGTCL